MSLGLDIIILVVIAVSVILGFKRGFIRSIMNFVTVILAGIGAWYFTPSLAAYLRDNYLKERFTEPVAESIDSMLNPALEKTEAMPKLFDDMPAALDGLLKRFGTSAPEAEQSISDAADNASQMLADFLAEPAVEIISTVLAFLLIFIVIAVVLTLLTLLLDLIFKLPVLKSLNRFGGILLGLICGAAYAWVISFAITAAMPYLAQVMPDVFTVSTAENTMLVNFFASYNPLSLFNINLFS